MLAIINYGLGNLTSIKNMCRRLGIDATITSDPETIRSASKLLLPGVGHFKKGMENLHSSGLKPLLDELVLVQKKPILGICLGAQLMTKHSEEGDVEGLGWVDAKTVRFDQSKDNLMKVPHMGWSEITTTNANPLWSNLPSDPRFYFVHTYHFQFDEPGEISATCNYSYDFVCAFQKGNIYGTQFHPEKSHKFGMKVLENFNQL
ncbi:MAG TPA: imidazole glycerol phosphate synthase subunit HisH [Flavisolibacter sp.]|nr:imidazole glycerol phosphate synthase subunit HisH [Flavisolibacter sp.]